MPKELRKLVFTTEELKSAAFDYCLRNKVGIPEAPIGQVIVEDSNDNFLTLCFETVDLSDPKKISLNRDKVGAALIKYCSANDIPMPRQAKKILTIDNGDVAMMINLNWARSNKTE